MIALLLMLADGQETVRDRVNAQPWRVIAFIERRADCNHWGGEEPYDAERRREIEKNVRDLRCVSVDRDERRLRKRYRNMPAVLAILDETADLPGID